MFPSSSHNTSGYMDLSYKNGSELVSHKLSSRSDFREHVLCLDQKPGFISGTLLNNLTLGLKQSPQVITFINKLIDQFDLKIDLYKKIDPSTGGFSGGESKKLEIIRGIIHHTFCSPKKIVILDEIRSNTDPATTKLLTEIFEKYFKDVIIIELTHDMSYIKDKDQVIILSNGSVKQGSYAQIKKTSQYSNYLGFFGVRR